jgi:hypothetical protein
MEREGKLSAVRDAIERARTAERRASRAAEVVREAKLALSAALAAASRADDFVRAAAEGAALAEASLRRCSAGEITLLAAEGASSAARGLAASAREFWHDVGIVTASSGRLSACDMDLVASRWADVAAILERIAATADE